MLIFIVIFVFVLIFVFILTFVLTFSSRGCFGCRGQGWRPRAVHGAGGVIHRFEAPLLPHVPPNGGRRTGAVEQECSFSAQVTWMLSLHRVPEFRKRLMINRPPYNNPPRPNQLLGNFYICQYLTILLSTLWTTVFSASCYLYRNLVVFCFVDDRLKKQPSVCWRYVGG